VVINMNLDWQGFQGLRNSMLVLTGISLDVYITGTKGFMILKVLKRLGTSGYQYELQLARVSRVSKVYVGI